MATDYPKPDSLLVGPRGVGQPFDAILTKSLSVIPAQVAAATLVEQSVTVTGVLATDYVQLVGYPADTGVDGPTGACRVSAANTVQVTYVNPTAGALTPPSGTYTFLIFRISTNPSK